MGVWYLVPILVFLAGPALAEEQIPDSLRHLAVQHNGRVKPLDSYAWEVLDQVTGKPRFGSADPVQTVLSIMAMPGEWQEKLLVSVPYGPLRAPLGLGPKQTHISYDQLVGERKLMKMLPAIVEKQDRSEKLTILENETMDVFERFVALTGLIQQKLALVPAGREWKPITESPEFQPGWERVIAAAREGDAAAVERAAADLSRRLRELGGAAYPAPWRLRWEVLYNRAAPFKAARALYLLAALAFLLALRRGAAERPASRAAMGLFALAFLVHGAGIASRVVLGERPPVSNFYETMLWLPFVAAALALVFERVYRVRYFGLSAGILAAITLLLADHLPLDSSISPVVAILRSNLWLTIHVLTIVASYGALALATVLAHVYGVMALARRPAAELIPLDTFLYRTIQVGVVLLASGIMLGGVWANASWGRYWGWDPKETWALITMLWFLAVLHGRFVGWLKGTAVALATIGGFFLLLMTYYGVSFYLVGLHSYAGGNAKPFPPLLIAYLAAEMAFMSAVWYIESR